MFKLPPTQLVLFRALSAAKDPLSLVSFLPPLSGRRKYTEADASISEIMAQKAGPDK